MSWADEYLKELYKDSTYLTSRQLAEAKDNGFIRKPCKKDWYEGKTVDLYSGSYALDYTGTVTKIYPDGYCLIEVW